ncbi:glycosyltransferase [Bosea sp. FBZP-16]|uniref:glycosyltransferase family protein n=1 Tax=Bosea sp. FBZP-16 TaxID=2065382 RepID=UPI000C3173A1|nr:glycosyltransferase [Bosea sp. FBZP-16]
MYEDIKARYAYLAGSGATIVALPQDEYDHTAVLDQWLADLKAAMVYSLFPKRAATLYPRFLASGGKVAPALTGFLEDSDIEQYARFDIPFAQRPIDVGYRVRRLPANFGRFGQLKSEFGRVFAEAARDAFPVVDISDDPAEIFVGEDWPRFLCSCRFILASESGSSILDADGTIRDRVAAYTAEHPDASYEQVEEACFPELDQSDPFAAISPRVFEAALAGCCLVMIEGDYSGYATAGEDYIAVRPDFANIAEVVEQMKDLRAAEAMAQRFRSKIIAAPGLRYANWVPAALEAMARSPRPLLASIPDWDFHRRREAHNSLLLARGNTQIAELGERNRLLGNALMEERATLSAQIDELRARLESEQDQADRDREQIEDEETLAPQASAESRTIR